jgi:hypothetical protein
MKILVRVLILDVRVKNNEAQQRLYGKHEHMLLPSEPS